ncbi:hypothetical protein PPERSA_09148 [Pseudocohnilembus persalinus]|uniref:PhoD-like phosphatase metallophosphatase domain-containing protein n=1 Tax=Pseudocohnilembus persalinus TaxID=266149 RepID=A0A0V0QXG2_PSEPJ|nr:hypothetical protein PPERSA_09148 [Pseudocohnilembus persalinus]|eukprot:KRX06746.1 hypothetical protein PPERSA_09148 [Pseudocohnilembus persalinus]
MASCAKTSSDSKIFTKILEQDLDFFIQMGDLHYMDIAENKVELFYEGYSRVFNSSRQKQLYSSIPIVYTYDDHDFGENDSDSFNIAKPAALEAYNEWVPHYQIPENGIYQYFIYGQSIIIMLDVRTFRNKEKMLGNDQMKWVQQLLEDSSIMSQISNIFLVQGVHWLEDDWDIYDEERKDISVLLQKYQKQNKQVFSIGGDAHMTGFDNGYNNPLGDYHILVSGPMDKANSCKGGEFIYGPYMEQNQFTTIQVQENNF